MLAQEPVVGLAARQPRAVDAALLTGADADRLAVLDVADGVGLGVFERDERDDEVDPGLLRQLLRVRHEVLQAAFIDDAVVVALLEGDAEDVAVLVRGANVSFIDLHDVVVALLLGLEDLERLVGVARGDHAVGHLVLEVFRRGRVADVGQGRPVAVGAETVGAACTDIGAGDGGERRVLIDEVDLLLHLGERKTDSRAGGGDVLEAGSRGQTRRLLQIAHELPGVQRVHEVDIAGLAVEDRDREIAPVLHINAGRLLVGVAAILKFQFIHSDRSFLHQLGVRS